VEELVGDPFQGRVSPVFPAALALRQAPPVPLVIAGLPYAEGRALRDELKLSDEQAKKLAGAAARYREELQKLSPFETNEDTTKQRQELLGNTEKVVGDILTPDQLKRFKQVTLQQLAARPGPLAGRAVARYKEVIEGLKLTEAQREQLFVGEALDKVLTKDQQAKWKELLGEPFKGTLALGFPAGGPGGLRAPPLILRYAEHPAVQAELKLSDEQRKKVDDLRAKWREATRDIPPPRGPGDAGDEVRAKLAEATKAIDKGLADILTAEQHRRLHQIALQQTERAGLGAVLAAEGVPDKLALTADQQKQIKAIAENAARVRTLILNDNSFESGPPAGGLANETVTKLNKATDEKLAGLLTRDQKATLKELLGEPFKGELGRSSGGGFGGAGGGGFAPSLPPGFAPPA
jgi:hypothetical protein